MDEAADVVLLGAFEQRVRPEHVGLGGGACCQAALALWRAGAMSDGKSSGTGDINLWHL